MVEEEQKEQEKQEEQEGEKVVQDVAEEEVVDAF